LKTKGICPSMKVVSDNDGYDKESQRWSMITIDATMVFGDTMIVAINNEDHKMIMAIVKTNISVSSSRQWLMMTRKVFKS